MPRLTAPPLTLCALGAAIFLTGCGGGPRQEITTVPFYRQAEVELADSHKTMAIRIVGEGKDDLYGLDRNFMLPNIAREDYSKADLKIEIHVTKLGSQTVNSDQGPVHDAKGNVVGYVHWKDYLFHQKGSVRAFDIDNKEIMNTNVDIEDTVWYGFSVRGPGKNIPKGGDYRLTKFGANRSYYNWAEYDHAIRANWPKVVEVVKRDAKRRFESIAKEFKTRFTSSNDNELIYFYQDDKDKSPLFTGIRESIESLNKENIKAAIDRLEAIVAGGFMDPRLPADKPTELSPKYVVAIRFNLGVLSGLSGNTKKMEEHFNAALALDPKLQQDVSYTTEDIQKVLSNPTR